MASSNRSSRLGTPDNGGETEPFPSMPTTATAGPSSSGPNITTTTTTTGPTITTTTKYSHGRPYTVTSSQPATNASTPSITTTTPTTVITSPNATAGSSTTRITNLPPQQINRIRPIGIRRLPSSNLRAGYEAGASATDVGSSVNRSASGRGRSTSAPQHASNLTVPGQANTLTRQSTRQSLLAPVAEHPGAPSPADAIVDRETMNESGAAGVGRRRSVSNAARSVLSRFSDHSREHQEPEYESEVVDLLDVLGMLYSLNQFKLPWR